MSPYVRFAGETLRSAMLPVIFLLVLSLPALAEDGGACSDAGLEQTLDMLPTVTDRRHAQLFDCTLYAHTLAEAGIPLSELPGFVAPELFQALTDGLLDNGEFFALGACADGTARLTVEVPPCASYQGMNPARNLRLGRSLFYAELLLDVEQAEALCRAAQTWCSDCQ